MGAQLKTAQDELADLFERSSRYLASALLRIARGEIRGNSRDKGAAEHEALEVISRAMQFADLLGRRRVLLEVGDKAESGELARAHNTPLLKRISGLPRVGVDLANVPFDDAIDDLLARTPELARSGDLVAQVYSNEHGFAAAYSPSRAVTQRAQKAISDAVARGTSMGDVEAILQDMGDWSRAYAETVFRTNLATAYSAGRWKQVSDPDVAAVIPAMRYDAVGDKDTRPNHEAADGLIASINDPIWDRFTPPLGYNCRCTLELVDVFTLERMGLLNNGRVKRQTPPGFSRAHPDSERFGQGRPDRRIYGF